MEIGPTSKCSSITRDGKSKSAHRSKNAFPSSGYGLQPRQSYPMSTRSRAKKRLLLPSLSVSLPPRGPVVGDISASSEDSFLNPAPSSPSCHKRHNLLSQFKTLRSSTRQHDLIYRRRRDVSLMPVAKAIRQIYPVSHILPKKCTQAPRLL